MKSFDAVTRDFVIVGANAGEYGFIAGAQVAFLQRVMGLVVGKEAVDKDEVARALALKEMAKNMPSFGNITITADVLSDLVAAFTGSSKAGQ